MYIMLWNNFEEDLHTFAYESRYNPELKTHSWDHTLRVVHYAKMIIPSLLESRSDKLLENTLIAAYFHDTGRNEDGRDRDHGYRSAEIVREKMLGFYPKADIESIVFAIEHHSDRNAPNGGNPTVNNYDVPEHIDRRVAMVLWDSDRLDLLRIPRCTSIYCDFLNTEKGKEYANSPEHVQYLIDCVKVL